MPTRQCLERLRATILHTGVDTNWASIVIEPRHVGLTVWRVYVLGLGEPIRTNRYNYPRGVRDPPGAFYTHRPVLSLSHRWIEFIRL